MYFTCTLQTDKDDKAKDKRKNLPLADNGEVVLNTLVVDVLVLLHVGHLDLLGSRGSGRLGKGAKGSLDGSSLFVLSQR
jgi:hypothetical protein